MRSMAAEALIAVLALALPGPATTPAAAAEITFAFSGTIEDRSA